MDKSHEHKWKFHHKSCCYVLQCIIPGCARQTTARSINGRKPEPGDRVKFIPDGYTETIKVI